MTSLAVVVSGFPRRSETFALNELLALERHGMLAGILATKPGAADGQQPGCERLLPKVEYLAPGTAAQQAEEAVARLRGRRIDGVHGYFAHRPAEVAERAARRHAVPFGFSVHARDARKITAGELGRRARAAACVVACNHDVAESVRRAGGKVHLLPHGVDMERFVAKPINGSEVLRVLAVGRLVEKKGFAHLIAAVPEVDTRIEVRIVGDGPLKDELARAIRSHRVDHLVTLRPGCSHERLVEEYAWCDVLVAPSVEDRSGDRDGLPNVVLEAMASGRPVVGSRIAAIPSAVRDEWNGVLVPPGEPIAIAAALTRLGRDRDTLAAYGRAAREVAHRDFRLPNCTRRLRRLLQAIYV